MEEREDYYFFPSFVFVSQYRKLSFETHRCLRKLLVAKKMWFTSGSSRFWFEFLCVTLPEISIGDSSFVQKISGSETFLWMQGRISRVPVEFFLSRITEKFHWELFGASKNLLQRKVCMEDRRGYHIFCRKLSLSRFRKIPLGTLRCFRKLLAAKPVYGCVVDNTFFRRNFFVSLYQKFHWELFVVSESFRQRKLLMEASGDITFSRRSFFVSHFRKPSLGILRCLKENLAAESLYG